MGANIFVLRMPNEWSTLDMFTWYDSLNIGRIVGCRVVPSDKFGVNKGYGFVSYETVSAATEAIKQTHHMMLKGRLLEVKLRRDDSDFLAN